jgi:hypothetical protein
MKPPHPKFRLCLIMPLPAIEGLLLRWSQSTQKQHKRNRHGFFPEKPFTRDDSWVIKFIFCVILKDEEWYGTADDPGHCNAE